ncbi:hypothetical protein ACLVWU_06905 [Bdellovibrio sp. HCB290]|uniref:hypothetical protein n=1 Tax=Bdellovibrio sp. HCB290 TaxID=3394356 RepID=UPI0039B36D13
MRCFYFKKLCGKGNSGNYSAQAFKLLYKVSPSPGANYAVNAIALPIQKLVLIR